MTRWPDPDPSKPNHYSWDSLGDPYRCKGDHNHPPLPKKSMAERAAELLICALVGAGAALIAYGVWGLGVLLFG